MGDREARTQDALVCRHTGAAEDAAARRPARPDGTSVIVNRALRQGGGRKGGPGSSFSAERGRARENPRRTRRRSPDPSQPSPPRAIEERSPRRAHRPRASRASPMVPFNDGSPLAVEPLAGQAWGDEPPLG